MPLLSPSPKEGHFKPGEEDFVKSLVMAREGSRELKEMADIMRVSK